MASPTGARGIAGSGLLAFVALLLVGCQQSPESVIVDTCRKTHSASVCDCVVKNLRESGYLEKIAENIDSGAAKVTIQGTAAVCAAQQK